MILPLNLLDNDVEAINKYASFQRTLKRAIDLLSVLAETVDSDTIVDDVNFNIAELRHIEPLIGKVHIAIRDAYLTHIQQQSATTFQQKLKD